MLAAPPLELSTTPEQRERMPDLRIWIDATRPAAALPLFGMSLLERALRGILQVGLAPTEICIDFAPGGGEIDLPADLAKRLPLRSSLAEGTTAERLARAFAERPEQVLIALEADCVIDPRVIARIAATSGSLAVCGGEGDERAAVLRLEKPPSVSAGPGGLDAVARAWLAAGAVHELPLDDVPGYVKELRRQVSAYLFRIHDAAGIDRTARFLFWSNYKGSTDFFTKYVYPPLVWRLLPPLARWRVHPNWISVLNGLLAFGAVPLFAGGWWISAFVCAYVMSVLDSVDGKLARLTYRASALGNVLDHGLDLVHPPFWYAAWAWAIGGGPTSVLFQASLWLAGLYFVDRIVIRLFTWRTSRSIHAYTPLDVRLRTWISRRNINLPLFGVGLLVGAPIAAFWIIFGWQVATLLFHGQRLAAFWNAKRAAAGAGVA